MTKIPLHCIESVMQKIYLGVRANMSAREIAITITQEDAGRSVSENAVYELWSTYGGKQKFKTEMRKRATKGHPLADNYIPRQSNDLLTDAELSALAQYIGRAVNWQQALASIGRTDLDPKAAQRFINRKFGVLANFFEKHPVRKK